MLALRPPTRSLGTLGADEVQARGASVKGTLLLASLLDVHKAWAWVVIIGNGLAGLWALGSLKLPSLRTRALWWFTTFTQLAVFAQVAMGVGMVAGQKRQAPQFHMFYGFVAIITVAIIYSYRNQMKHKLYLLYGLGGLFIMGLGIRAMLKG